MGGRAVVDERRSLPGRGAWLHPDAECLALAVKRRALQRALRVAELDVTGLAVGDPGSCPPTSQTG
ncbi:YlxR family protein [Demequina pelophila]|uniref:YlxR family protein n=1 Tax=Demequina pelophila TaxID=1638984 RepID=UPI0034E2E8BC